MQLSLWADILSVISGIMTIVGIGGFLSWTAFKGGSDRLSNTVMSVFVYSLKTALCLLLAGIIGMLGVLFHSFIYYVFLLPLSSSIGLGYFTSAISGGAIGNPSFVISLIVTIGIFLPTYLLACVSIYTWSLEPFKRFLHVFRRKLPSNKLP